MIRYRYTHTQTEATTGFFSCEPDPPLSPDALFACLAGHPFDDFLRRHALARMAAMEPAQAAALLRRSFPESLPPSLEALVMELALLNPAWEQADPLFSLKEGTEDLTEASSLILLRWRRLPDKELHRQWGRFFAGNIRKHRALPPFQQSGLAPLYPEASLASFRESSVDASSFSVPEPAFQEAETPLPGCSPSFTAPFPLALPEVHAIHKALPFTGTNRCRPPSEETAALAEERLSKAGILAGGLMRHTASLSPIGLLRPWRVRLEVQRERQAHSLEGEATAYGRGLSLADAKASCLMEIVERASVYRSINEVGLLGGSEPVPLVSGTRASIRDTFGPALDPNDFPLEVPYRNEVLTWMPGVRLTTGQQQEAVYVPAQMAMLFCNLDEIALCDAPGSTGIAAGCFPEEARLAALLEILERDAEATSLFNKATCFRLQADPARDPLEAALLADYTARGIHVHFQDITGPTGLPVYKCFVMSARGAIAAGYGAGLSGRRAALSAMTETPFPYPDAGPSGPLLRNLPVRMLHELPDYSLGSAARDLAMLEDLLLRNMRPPVYVDLSREDLAFPVVRAFIPGLETAFDGDSFSRVPLRLYAAYRNSAGV